MVQLPMSRSPNRCPPRRRHPLSFLIAFVSCAAGPVATSLGASQLVAPSSSVADCDIVPAMPVPPAHAQSAPKPSGADDTNALQAALNRLKPGDWLVVPPETYSISKRLTVSVDGITLYGKGATLKASNPAEGALVIAADDVAVYGFSLIQSSTSRQSTPWAGGIAVIQTNRSAASARIRGAIVQGNHIQNAAATGIFVFRADGFTIADNTIHRSLADGIHITAGSTSGRVIHNTISQTGDDMIAVVSYTGDRSNRPAAERYKNWDDVLASLARDIYIARNDVSDNYQGRGISVVGGSDVTIENNSISRVPTAAGIYLERETSWMSLGVHNVLVRGNTLTDIETSPPTYKPANVALKPTHHGAIEIGSFETDDEKDNAQYRSALAVTDVAITDNVLQSWGFAPIRIGVGSGPVENIEVSRNKFLGSKTAAAVEAHPGLISTTLACSANQLDGSDSGSQCGTGLASAKLSPSVTGASLSCSADGRLRLGSVPKGPSNLQLH